ncbi:uncharacterized protein LOC106146038 [Columba livia]|uniref:uncharacterized protein LOC106146038 n=1 Tax=Columba livia TaxID=8932 RepID=UPI000A3C6918|nr:extensin-2-like [Columba livia]
MTMHYYGEPYKPLYFPGSGYITENLQPMPRSDACSTTCHPVSVIKCPMPTWQTYTQPLAYMCPQPSMTQTPLLSCQPHAQQCILLYPEPCETTHLLPCRKPSLKICTTQDCQPCKDTCPEKKHEAKSLPPCVSKYPELKTLRFPPCGVKNASSCVDECRSQKISKCSSQQHSREPRPLQGMTSSYSPPLQGVSECPPQPCIMQPFPHEHVSNLPPQNCMKGYPTQEHITSSQQCVTKCLPLPHMTKCPPPPQVIKCPPPQVTKCPPLPHVAKCPPPPQVIKCPQLPPQVTKCPPHVTKCPPPQQMTKCSHGQGIKESSSQKHAGKCLLSQEGVKYKSSSTQNLSKSKCLYTPTTQHSPLRHTGGVKRSCHHKKSRCESKWLC